MPVILMKMQRCEKQQAKQYETMEIKEGLGELVQTVISRNILEVYINSSNLERNTWRCLSIVGLHRIRTESLGLFKLQMQVGNVDRRYVKQMNVALLECYWEFAIKSFMCIWHNWSNQL